MWKPTLAGIAVVALLTVPTVAATASGDDVTPTAQPAPSDVPAATAVSVCDRRCHLRLAYRKLRRSTPRDPLPAYIVACESHGSLRAQNPSGAGGRYQIMPSTWEANLPSRRFVRVAQSVEYRFRRPGHDEGPTWSERLLQDKVAGTIAARSGYSPWSCA